MVILHLRTLCETKQKSHLHIGECPQVTTDTVQACVWRGVGGGELYESIDMLNHVAIQQPLILQSSLSFSVWCTPMPCPLP